WFSCCLTRKFLPADVRMKPDDIYASIQKTWEFLVPAISEVFVLLVVTAIILGPNAVHEQFAHFPASSSLLPSDHLREVFSFYGISTLLPLIAVFMFVLFASAVSRIAHAIGSLLPGEMVFNSTVMLEKFADHADLVNLLAAYKLLKEPNSLN